MPLIVASSNVQNLGVHLSAGNDLSRADVKKCGKAVARMGVDLCGFQEVAEKADRQDLAAGLGDKYGFLTSGNEYSELALAYNKEEFQYVHGSLDEFLLMHGEAGLEPNRYYLRAHFKRIGWDRLAPISFGTTHTISKAWSGSVHGAEAKMRQGHWNEQWDKVGEHEKHDLQRGLTVIGTGDLNRTHNMPRNHKHQRFLAHNGLDWVWVTEGSVGVEPLEVVTKNTPSDHDIVGERVRLHDLAA